MNAVTQYDHLGFPSTLLGMSHSSWTRQNIQIILDHYRWRYDTHSKRHLMQELDLLVQEYGLDLEDRREILKAARLGKPLPRCKPRVRRVPHTTLPGGKSAARRALAQKPTRIRTRSQAAVAASATTTPDPPNDTNFTNPKPHVTSSLSKECVVCYETLNPRKIPQRRITSACNHEPDVCIDCLATSISTQFNSKVWDQISCPTCSQRLDFEDVKAFADPDVFTRYDNFALQSCLSGGGQFQQCRHPHCQSGQQCFPEQDSYMICVACGRRTCITCDTIWHPSKTCADVAAKRAKARGKEEAAATRYLETNVKLCPRCNARGEKESGCDHMTCPQCHCDYCWVCLVDYDKIRKVGNTGHRKDCRYHSDNLPPFPRHGAARATEPPQVAAPQTGSRNSHMLPILRFLAHSRTRR